MIARDVDAVEGDVLAVANEDRAAKSAPAAALDRDILAPFDQQADAAELVRRCARGAASNLRLAKIDRYVVGCNLDRRLLQNERPLRPFDILVD